MIFADLTDYQIAQYFAVDKSTVSRWRHGQTKPPAYAPLTVSAILAKLEPIDIHRFTPITVARTLDTSMRVVKGWYATTPPLAACLALAAVSPMSDVLTQKDLKTLRNIRANRYYRSRYGWSARAVMGKPVQAMRDETPDRLVTAGYVVIKDGKYKVPYLSVTNKGKTYLDTMAQRA